MEIDHHGFEVLGRAECLRLLDGRNVGRVAGTSGALPVVLPVDYALDGDTVVVRSGRGTALDFATSGAVVAFEVDNLHEHGHLGWTVMITGVVEEIPDGPEALRLRSLPALHDPGSGGAGRLVRISSEIVSGRRTHRTRRHARSRAAARGR